MMDSELIIWDGVKAVNINRLPASAWVQHTPHTSEQEEDIKKLYRAVPWLFRGVALRADAIAALPFALVDDSGEEYDTSEDWENKVDFLPHPEELLWLVEAGLSILPEAYLFRQHQLNVTQSLRHIRADSIVPVIDEKLGLVGFTRQLGTGKLELKPEDLVYFWRPDPFTEIGPAQDTAPAYAASQAAGVLFNLDKFAAAFMARGAIKATMLKVGRATEGEKKKIKAWWKRVFQGIENAFTAHIVSGDVETEIIGEGLGELSDSELTREKREDIAAALGIPMTLLWSTEAGGLGGGGVVTQDEKHFYSKTIVPEARFIARVFNDQLFADMNLRLEFRPETLDVFQEDEGQRATAYKSYVDSKMRRSVAAQILGIELPEGMEYEDLDDQYEEDRESHMADMQQQADSFGQGGPPNANREAMRADLRRWRTKARKAGGVVPFESEFIPPALKASIGGAIEELGVEEAFGFLKKKNLKP